MITFLKISKKLYWLGLIGLIGTFFHIPGLKLFYLFFLLVIINFILSCILILKTDRETDDENVKNLKFLFQNLGMLLGIPYIYLRNRFRLPNISNYKPQVLYSLPFEGAWTVANGGTVKETSHSWNICPQRYAYDFFIEENGQSFQGSGKDVTDYAWTVANGGTVKETSHSWNICPQRYAYDFFIEENGQSFQGSGKDVTDYLCYGKPTVKETSHSWNICPQRYAYDFFIEENGQSFQGSGKDVTDYLCYGKPILSPADGVVVELKNQFEDTPISENQEVLCSSSDVRGNYIVIQHSSHEYSTIAHIKKDSFCVKPGDKISRSQLIARCGNRCVVTIL